MKIAYHYYATAAIAAEALIRRGFPRARAADIAILIATADEMVDWATPKNLPIDRAKGHDIPGITQVYPTWGARLLFGGGTWPIMKTCDLWHFDPANGWPHVSNVLLTENSPAVTWMRLGAHLHTAQDTDGPHAGYVGYPTIANYLRTKELNRLDWYENIIRIRKSLTWGHMLDPAADNIENCRKGALSAAKRFYVILSLSRYLPGNWNDDGVSISNCTQTLIAVSRAKNNSDLIGRSRRAFRYVTERDLPNFVPFKGRELKLWINSIFPEEKK